MVNEFAASKNKYRKLVKGIIASAFLLVFICLTIIGGISYTNSIIPNGIVIHHSAVPFPINNPRDISIISNLHQKRGFSIFYWGKFYSIGYHYVILPDGTLIKGRPENVQGAHAIGHNSYIGVCLIGDFSEKDNPKGEKGPQAPTNDQLKSLIDLTRKLREHYQIPITNIVSHKSVESKTECPGEKFPMIEYLMAIEN